MYKTSCAAWELLFFLFLFFFFFVFSSSREVAQSMAAGSGRARVVVAVDFGTTFSGFAYARTSDPDDVFKIYEWPGAGTACAKPYCKTQTSLFYAPPSSKPDAPLQLVDWGWPALSAYAEAACAFSKSESAAAGELVGLSDRLRWNSLLEYLAGLSLSALLSREGKGGRLNPGESSGCRDGGVLAVPPEIAQKVGFFATKFKLLLAPHSCQNDFRPPLPAGLTVEQLVVDYLRCLAGFIMSELQVNYGKHFTMKDVQWCLTVPAIWDERAKQLMKVCAEKAGMVQGPLSPGSATGSPFPVDIILEPEAASIYCQHKSKGLRLKKGDKLLVADVGGGTIDLVVHEKADADPEIGRVHEVVSSYGDVGGGTFVDADFFRFVCQKIGCFEEFSRTNKSTLIKIFQWWQGVKATFDGGEGYSAELTLPKKLRKEWEKYEQRHELSHDDDYYDELKLESSEIKAIFDTEVGKVISLINKQVKGIRVLMLVGGFSESPYLKARIKSAFETRVEEIVIPENPGSAVCHGAVQLHLKKDLIQSRIAKRTYGIRFNRDVQDGDPKDLRYKNDDGNWRCRDCIDVFVRTGDRVPLDASITRNYHPYVHHQRTAYIELVSSANKYPKYVREAGVVKEGSFIVDISRGMHVDKDRYVKATMTFGASLVLVRAEYATFGKAGEERSLSVTFHNA